MKIRLDVDFYAPHFQNINDFLANPHYPIRNLEDLLLEPPLNGFDARDYQTTGISYLRVQNVRPFEVILDDVKFVSPLTLKDIKAKGVALKSGDVLLTRKGSFGMATVVTEAAEDCLISSEIILLRLPSDSECTSGFLVGWLNCSMGQHILDRRKTGGIMGHITQEVVKSFPVPLPPLSVQQKLTSQLQTARSQRNSHLEQADALLSGLDAWLLEQLGLTPPAPDTRSSFAVTLGQIKDKPFSCTPQTLTSIHLLKTFRSSKFYRGELKDFVSINPRMDVAAFHEDDLVSFLPMENVGEKNGNFQLQIKSFGEVSTGYTRFAEGDLVWAKITPCMQNGKSAVIRGSVNSVSFGSTEFHVLRPKTADVSSDYLQAFLSLNSFLYAAQAAFSGSAGQQRVSADFLSNLPLPLPPLPLQQTIAAEVTRRRDNARRLRDEAESAWESAKVRFEAQLLGGETL